MYSNNHQTSKANASLHRKSFSGTYCKSRMKQTYYLPRLQKKRKRKHLRLLQTLQTIKETMIPPPLHLVMIQDQQTFQKVQIRIQPETFYSGTTVTSPNSQPSCREDQHSRVIKVKRLLSQKCLGNFSNTSRSYSLRTKMRKFIVNSQQSTKGSSQRFNSQKPLTNKDCRFKRVSTKQNCQTPNNILGNYKLRLRNYSLTEKHTEHSYCKNLSELREKIDSRLKC